MNLRGAWTLFGRETRRFFKVRMQTIVAPALTALLYLIVFRYAMGSRTVPGLSVAYFDFLVPGLAMMAMMQNAFANTSSSLIAGKVMHVHAHLLMAPLSAAEVVAAFLLAALMRALVVASVFLLVLVPFVDLPLPHPALALFFTVCAALTMGGMGLIGGMWAKKFDDMATVNNFVIMPLTFLSGVFYSIGQLPEMWQRVNGFNPFFYLVDGFRYALLGVGECDPRLAAGFVLMVTLLVVAADWWLWRAGWRMKE
ncbi:MAG: metal-dependent hydrolase [Zetaproteobacteria bacterium]|nr:MAG: metal-dependent hydrolase [Zetaproteobacteria bacterium]